MIHRILWIMLVLLQQALVAKRQRDRDREGQAAATTIPLAMAGLGH
jgi:uncharacterized membrane protein YhaH (DUF805 family)